MGFQQNEMVYDAVIRNLEIIGEAARNIPQEFRDKYSTTDWRQISALRNILAHAYHGIDNEIVWDIIQNELEPLKVQVTFMLQKLI